MPGQRQGQSGGGTGQTPGKGQSQAGTPGGGRRRGMNTSGLCVCPLCGMTVEHQRGNPCFEQKCPGCGASMTRGQ